MIIGIDPGLTGAIALVNPKRGLLAVEDMPVKKFGKRKKVDPVGLAELLRDFKKTYPPGLSAVVEDVNAAPINGRRQGTTSMFNFGTGYGVVQGCLASAFIPYRLVLPQRWKRQAGLIGCEKDASRTVARLLYPDAPLNLKKHHGRADAILIAHYGGNTYGY